MYRIPIIDQCDTNLMQIYTKYKEREFRKQLLFLSILICVFCTRYLENMEMDENAKILKYLVSVELLAQEIMSDKREIVLLDKRRNQNREALRDLNKGSQTKCWVTVGSILVKHDIVSTRSLLEADQKQLDIDINKLRSDLKIKVNNLRDLEMQPPIPGFTLVPMSQEETRGLSSAGLFSK